jgi:hypothetical protein
MTRRIVLPFLTGALAAGAAHAETPPPAAPGPIVTLRSDNPNPTLQRHIDASWEWEDVCPVPCGVRVDPNGVYRIAGNQVRRSDPFRLERTSGDVVIDVKAGSSGRHYAGLGLVIGGLGAIALGVAAWKISHDVANAATGRDRDADNKMAWQLGLTFGGIGLVMEAIGIPLWSSSTSVAIH